MSYLVLARKYRPQTFDEIVGQEHVTRTLANAFQKGRVHHAFLFCGARGVGKTTAARVLAKALCCDRGPTATPCGVCDPCTTITSGTAVDYFEIDGASNNGVDDIRELRDGVRYQPAQLRRKIYVIDEVHMLSVAAFNALLKTLEEPPPHVTFIFATTEVHKIPITILSRTQRYDFKLVPQGRLLAHLERILTTEKIPVEPGALALLAREAGGSVRDALSLTDQVVAYAGGEPITEALVAEVLGVADRALLSGFLHAVLERDPRSALVALDAAIGRGVDLSHLARTFLMTLRDAAVVQAVADPEGLVDLGGEELERVRALVKPVPRPHLLALFDRFAKACEELARSQSPRLLLDVAFVDMASAEPLLPIAELVDRLGELEARLAGSGAPRRPAPAPAPSRPPVRSAPAAPAPSPSPPPPARPRTEPASAARPPAAAAAPPPARTAPADPMAEWERVIRGLERKSVMLAGYYAHARLLSWDDRAIELGFPGESVSARMAGDAENLGQLKRFVAELVGAPVDIRLKTIAAAAPTAGVAPAPSAPRAPASVVEVEGQRKTEAREKREQEAQAHPLTKAVMETFGASIKEIKVDG